MKILPTIPNKNSEKVKSYDEIREDVEGMIELIDSGNFLNNQECAALAHVQVSKEPKRFLVLNERFEDVFNSRVIINPTINSKESKTKNMESCMSYPYRNPKKVTRYENIQAEYQIPKKNEETGEYELEWENYVGRGFPAYVFQHEVDHLNNTDIYDK